MDSESCDGEGNVKMNNNNYDSNESSDNMEDCPKGSEEEDYDVMDKPKSIDTADKQLIIDIW